MQELTPGNLKRIPYPYNLIEYIKENMDTEGEPFDFTATDIVVYMAENLTDKQMKIAELRFRDGLTLKEIGEQFDGVSRERIRQIEASVLEKLLDTEKLRNYSSVPYRKYITAENSRKEAEKRLDWVLTHVTMISAGNPIPKKVSVNTNVFTDRDTLDLPVEDLDLSVRSYNVLKRNGMHSIYDVIANLKEMKDLYELTNLGAKSAQEIIDKVHNKGLRFQWEECA